MQSFSRNLSMSIIDFSKIHRTAKDPTAHSLYYKWQISSSQLQQRDLHKYVYYFSKYHNTPKIFFASEFHQHVYRLTAKNVEYLKKRQSLILLLGIKYREI